MRAFIASFVCAVILGMAALLPSAAHAQVTLLQSSGLSSVVAPLILSSNATEYPVSRYARVIPDNGARLSFAEVLDQFRRGQGTAISRDQVFSGYDDSGYWVLFSVYNRNPTKSLWTLDFGSRIHGTLGIADQIYVYSSDNALRPLTIDGRAIETKWQMAGQTKNALPLNLTPGEGKIIGFYLKPAAGLSTVINMHLTEQQSFNTMQEREGLEYKIIFGATIFICAVYGLFYLLYRNPIPLFLGVYLAARYFIFTNSDSLLPIGNDTAAVLYEFFHALAALMAIQLTRDVLFDARASNTMTRLLVLARAVVIGAFILGAIVPSSAPFTAMLLLRIMPIILPAVMAGIGAVIVVRQNRPQSIMFTLSWAVLAVCAFLGELNVAGHGEYSPASINVYWIGFILHLTLLSFATLRYASVVADRLLQQKNEAQRRREEENEMRKTKEQADQSRLLGIMQREKELMNDLRTREAERIEALKRAKDMADQNNKSKSDFLAVISHEIRTPMTGIMGMTRLLLDTTLSEKQREFASTIQYAGDGLITLLNDILDLSKVEEGKMTLEHLNFDLHKTVESIVLLMSGRAEEKKVAIRGHIDPAVPRWLKGDPTRLRQILLNLVSNAIKFTERGEVTITVKVQDNTAKKPRIYFSVRDTGMGISVEAQKKLFMPYEQADASISRHFGGTGLGLAICKRLSEAMGGSIQVESVMGKGSNFYFILPFDIGSSEGVAGAETAAPSAPLNILVVDDNVINQRVVTGLLEKDKHRIVAASSAEAALNEIKSQDFDIILMDMEMPVTDGVAATKLIRALPDKKKAAVPIIAMTANNRREDIERCKEAGMNDYVAKPINPETLRQQLAHFAKKTKPADQAATSTPQANTPQAPAPQSAQPQAQAQAPAPTPTTSQPVAKPEPAPTPAAAPAPIAASAPAESAPAAVASNVFSLELMTGLRDGLGRDQLADMLDGLYQKSEELIGAAEKAINDNDHIAAAMRGHDIKGMTANFGLTALSELASRLERQAKEKYPFDTLRDIVAKMRPCFYDTRSAVDKWIKS